MMKMKMKMIDDRCELQVGGDKRRYRNRQAVRPAQPQQIDESL